MKWFYAFNTQDEENESYDGNEFIVDNISEVEMDEILKKSDDNNNKRKSKMSFQRLWLCCGAVLLVLVLELIFSLFEREEESLWNVMLNEAPYLLIVFVACAVIFVVGCVKFGIKGLGIKSVLLSTVAASDGHDVNFEERLGIPNDAHDVDILSFDYNDDTDVDARFTECTNWEVKVFADDDNLYISDLESKFAFPKSELKRITTVRSKMSMLFWNKKISYKKDPYDRFKITKSKGQYEISTYYVLEVEHDGETWGIVFPCYELSTFQLLTGLTAEY